MITFRPEELQIPKRAGIYKIFRKPKKVLPNYSQRPTPKRATECSQKRAVEMLKTVVNNCRLLFLWIDNQIIEIKTEEKEEEKMLREKSRGNL